MTGLLVRAGEGLQATIYGVATAMLYPVLLLEVIALVLVSFEAGRFTLEYFRRWRARRRLEVETMQVDGGPQVLQAFGPSPVALRVSRSLGTGELTRSRVLKALADGEIEASRRLERTRVLVRVGPMLGLMGTLIPISPALVGLAKGNVQALSDNLVIAFSTTVVGLLIGGLAYLMTTVRDRMYQQDVVDIEYVFDRMEVTGG